MAKKQGLGSVRRFGTRYGRTVKNKLAKIEAQHRARHACPYCSRTAARRVSAGIWNCTKCSSKFAARAYTVGVKPTATAQTTHMVTEAIHIEEE